MIDDYIADPNACPYYSSTNITRDESDFSDLNVYSRIVCMHCNEVWTEVFNLITITFP